jgi:type IV pilus assembly protein PilX
MNMMSHRKYLFRSTQRGAALVMGLLLLLVLTVLAISGMNSASVEFLMAGNDQFRQNAFQAAETGIEQAMVVGLFNPAIPARQTLAAVVPGSANDNYSANIDLALGGCALPIYGSTTGSGSSALSAVQYDVTSTGTAARNSTTTHQQGVQVLVLAGAFTAGCGGTGGGLN